MTDITKCRDEDCPLKESCYRYTAPHNEYGQSYFMESPRKIHEDKTASVECDMYWGDKTESVYRQLKDIVSCKHVRREGESCRLNDKCTYPKCNLD